jgi:LmbE family N-acetylglucosaminyl deacetylase
MNWQAEASGQEKLRYLRSVDESSRLVVVAAHPDDETIGASCLFARLPRAQVIYVTDGAPHDNKLWSADATGSREAYAALRRREAERALAHAGVPGGQITFLGAVDQEAIFSAGARADRVAEILMSWRADLLVTHPYEGGHPDHDAAALISQIAVSKLGKKPFFIEMTSYHARGNGCETGVFLNSDAAAEEIVELSEVERRRKAQMMEAHRSQRAVLSGFAIDRERFRVAPFYDFSRPPHQGQLWYERMGWSMTGNRWRMLAAEALHEAQRRNAAYGT